MMKKLLLFVFALLPMVASADAVEIDGIYYNLITKGKVAEVTSNPNKYNGTVVIPESVTYENVDYSVTSIGNYAFESCSGLTSIIIPNSVTSIGNYAFVCCYGLTSFTIPNSVTSLGKSAFNNCSSLTSVTIPNSVTSMGEGVFSGCSGLTSVIIPNSVTTIESSAFIGCSSLTSVIIPNSVTSIGDWSFSRCSSLTSVTIPSSVTSIGFGAFKACSCLTSVTIPNSVTSIWNEAFMECPGLTSVTIPNSVTIIRNSTFQNCSGLTSVIIPNSVTSICYAAFSGCSGLTSVNIPNSVTIIEQETFAGCSSLSSVTIPNSVTSIGYYAFANCSSLIFVTLGSGIKNIDTEAFASCPELTDVYCHAINVPNTKADAFKDSYTEYATLHVPAESVNDYKAVEPWKYFKSIVSLEGGNTPGAQKCATPTISYKNGQLKFTSATDGAECVTNISDSDIKTHYGNEISLTVTYNISVYATKSGYDNSETATATLCWIDKEPTTEGITDGVTQIPSKAVLIQSEGGILKVEGVDDGTQVSVYTPDGKQAGSAVSRNGAVLIGTSIQPGNTAIVKIGDRAVKVIVR